MPKCVSICGVGSVDKSILEYLAECIAARCGLTCKIISRMESPEYAYNETRDQYNSKLILKHLLRQCPNDTLRFIGVTPVDLYVPILEFVFGLAQIEGQCSIISLHRLYPKFYGQLPNPDLVLVRLLKTALHELGHTFGITHCRDRRCVMYSSTRIEHTDFKQSDFCLTCSELFRWHLEKVMGQHLW